MYKTFHVEKAGYESFKTIAETIQANYDQILNGSGVKPCVDVLDDTLGEFGAIQAQTVAKIFILMRKSIPLERVKAKSRTSCFSAVRPLKQQRTPARRAL